MEKIEILSPVGDKSGFFASILSGADAVYMGLPKFNARMKAENITLGDLPSLIRYAHLKDVKVYITMNTLLNDAEIHDAVAMAGDCWRAGVDAFIVQDLGLISALKKAYPDIILHGSTQMGVHNVMGARVARKLGLSRVVLSRECTLSDIAEIHQNVDIELEVFVQGANCICFSGNCYLSSLKCGASGNRGECKQLCRLPYTLTDSKKSLSGYTLSPRDNCMLDNLSQLISLGVSSLKIEGRLRNLGYIKVATSVYKQAVDNIYLGKELDVEANKNLLKRVFARGEYVSGYNDSNNIIDIINNNHLGVLIGKVKSVSKFKDLYKIGMQLYDKNLKYISKDNSLNNATNTYNSTDANRHKNNLSLNALVKSIIHAQDGLKFKNRDKIVSIGVGNIETSGNITYVYAKNHVDIDSDVYLSKDTTLENSVPDLSRYRPIDITARVIAGEQIYIKFSCENYVQEYTGEVVEKAIKNPISDSTIASQLSKVDRDIFTISSIDISTQNAFVSLSCLNEIRRMLIDKLESDISSYSLDIRKKSNMNDCALPKDDLSTLPKDNLFLLHNDNLNTQSHEKWCAHSYVFLPHKIAIVDETSDIATMANNFDCLIFSPTVYSQDVFAKFYVSYSKFFSSPLLINLPIIARLGDIEIIDDIVHSLNKEDIILIANNIYGLHYASNYNVWAGAGLNVVNNSAISALKNLGVSNIISSCEKWTNRSNGTYKISNFPLMTITSCPVKLLHGSDCNNCKYSCDMKYLGNSFDLKIRRVKINSCYFELYDDKYSYLSSKGSANIIDYRF